VPITRGVLLAALLLMSVSACGDDDDDDGASTTVADSATAPADAAADLGVQSELRNGLTAAKTIATDVGGLAFVDSNGEPLDAEDLAAVEPSTSFDLVVVEPEGASIVLVKTSASGTSFCIAATSDGVVTYGSSDDPSNVDSIADCVDGSW
jgi:hypothetical protein